VAGEITKISLPIVTINQQLVGWEINIPFQHKAIMGTRSSVEI